MDYEEKDGKETVRFWLFVVVAVILGGFFYFSVTPEDKILKSIDKANHCETADDCGLVGSTCPFGCYIYVHVDDVENIKDILDGYHSKCMYACVQSSGVDCVEGKCAALYPASLVPVG